MITKKDFDHMKKAAASAIHRVLEHRFLSKNDIDTSHELHNQEDTSMKKLLAGAIVTALLFGIGFLLGLHRGSRKNIAAVDIVNESGIAIMTATIRHEAGTVIAANIKKNRRERVRFYTKRPNGYTITVTLENNRTLYSDTSRAIQGGDLVREVVSDSAIVRASNPQP
ncbi:MAG: hypothetical protein JW768_14285 [Chitinispirillaceae bacterium]|nr:hypothetical protein [Chitinispirillaceae bacterium]